MALDRRQFLTRMLGAAAGAWGRAASFGDDGDGEIGPASLPVRRLGRAEVECPVLALGGFHVGRIDAREGRAAAVAIVDAALEEGLRLLDNAESYQSGAAEEVYGEALAGRRDEVFLMTKTYSAEDRSADSAKRHLEGSLKRLGTDRLDLWQLHSVQSPEDVDRAFAKGGAWETIRAAKEQGVTRFIGVTGHVNPKANLRALHWFDEGFTFDTMQFPLNPLDAHQVSFTQQLLPELVKRDIGVIAMKISARGDLLERGLTTIEENLRYVLSLPVSVAVVGMESPDHVRQNAGIVRDRPPLDTDETAALLARLEPDVSLALEVYKQA